MKFLNSIDLSGNAVDNVKTPTLDAQLATKGYVDAKPAGGTTILNGTGPPADALGAVGNYYLDTVAKILYGPKGSVGYGADLLPINLAPTADQAGQSNTSYGSRFKTLGASRITALRYFRHGGSAAHTVTIILYLQSTSSEVARVVINNAYQAPGGWVTANLTTPLVVAAGTDYRIAFTPSVALPISIAYGIPVSSVPSLLSITGQCFAPTANFYPGTIDDSTCYFVDVVLQAYGAWPFALKSAP